MSLPVLSNKTCFTILNFNTVISTIRGGITDANLHAGTLKAVSDSSVNALVNRKHICTFNLFSVTCDYIIIKPIQVKPYN